MNEEPFLWDNVRDMDAAVEESNKQQAIQDWLSKPAPELFACACLGKANPGDPDCRCAMRWYSKVGDSWYKISEQRTPTGITHTATKVE